MTGGRAPQRYDLQDIDVSWHPRAACAPPDVPPEWFGAIDPHREGTRWQSVPRIQRALQVCDRCPVTRLCLRQGATDRYADGVYGGTYVRGGWRRD